MRKFAHLTLATISAVVFAGLPIPPAIRTPYINSGYYFCSDCRCFGAPKL